MNVRDGKGEKVRARERESEKKCVREREEKLAKSKIK